MQDRQISPHEQLYQDATRRLQRLTEYEACLPEEYTFAPRIIERPPDSCKLLDDEYAGSRKGGAALAERYEPGLLSSPAAQTLLNWFRFYLTCNYISDCFQMILHKVGYTTLPRSGCGNGDFHNQWLNSLQL